MFSKSHKHTHTHTHTRKSQKESERMVSVQSCGVSHTVWGERHAFSEGRSGCTNFLQFLGQWQLFGSETTNGDDKYYCHSIWVLSPFPSGVLSVHDSRGFFKFSKCICLHFAASCTKTWFDQTHILMSYGPPDRPPRTTEFGIPSKITVFFFSTSCIDFT